MIFELEVEVEIEVRILPTWQTPFPFPNKERRQDTYQTSTSHHNTPPDHKNPTSHLSRAHSPLTRIHLAPASSFQTDLFLLL